MKSSKTAKAKRASKQKEDGVPPLRRSLRRSLSILKAFWKPILISTVIYGVLYFLFVRVLTNVNIETLDESIKIVFGDGEDSAATRVITAASLFGAGASFDQTTAVYFGVIWFTNSLAMIWILRHIWAKKSVSVRDAYYQGMYPLVPMVMITLLMFIQAIPFSIALFIFQVAINNNLAIGLLERMGVLSILAAGIIVSGYWIVGSVVALYSSTVPGMRPMKAIRTAAEVLNGRRFKVLSQVLIFLATTGAVILGILLLVIWLKQDAAIVVTALLTIMLMPWLHLYFYGLYRDLLHE